MISLGGALGAVLVGIVAPLVLPAHFELPAGSILCALLLLWQVRRDYAGVRRARARRAVRDDRLRGLGRQPSSTSTTIVVTRNFYGVLRVQEAGIGTPNHRRQPDPRHDHARQAVPRSPTLRRAATTYYTATSGVGRLLESMHPRTEPLRVGVIGLGTGTLATYGAQRRPLPLLRHQSRT